MTKKIRTSLRRSRFSPVRSGILWSATFLLSLLLTNPLEAARIGDLDILPSVQFHTIYDDNVLRTPTGTVDQLQVGDWGFRIRPIIALVFDPGPTELELRYFTEFLFYTKSEVQDLRGSIAQTHNVTFLATHNFTPRFAMTFTDLLRLGNNIAELTEAGVSDVGDVTVLPDSRNYLRNQANLGATYLLTRKWSLIGDVEYRYNKYEVPLTPVPPAALDPTINREDHLGTVLGTAAFKWHPRNTVNATFGFSYYDYDLRGVSKIYFLTLGDSWQVLEALLLTAAVGVQYLYNQGLPGALVSSRDSTHPYGLLEAAYTLRDFTFLVSAAYRLQDSSGIAGTVQSRSVRGSIRYVPIPDLSMRVFGFYAKDDSVGEVSVGDFVEIESIQAGATATYDVLNWLSLNFQYYFIDQDTVRPGSATHYIDNRFLIGFVLSYPSREPDPS